MKHLIIPDTHAHPDFHNKRFEYLGHLINDIKPDHVIHMGDLADMPSLCTYDFGQINYEGRRYIKDIQSGVDALDRLRKPVDSRKKKLPKFWMLIGNHEYRIQRAINMDAKLEGVLSIDDLQFAEYGWEVVPYRGKTPGVLRLDGVSYSHYFPSGIMGRPISGVNPAYQLVMKYGHSCTAGHLHTFSYYHRSNALSNIAGLVCGVYQDYEADFAGVANDMWWRGVVVKHNVNKGMYDMEQISLDRIKKEYA